MSEYQPEDEPGRPWAEDAPPPAPPIGLPAAPSADSSAQRPAYRERRPRIVLTAGILLIALGVLAIFLTLGLLSQIDNADADAGKVQLLLFVQIALSVVQIGAGVFLMRGREWARITAQVVCALTVAGFLFALFSGTGQSLLGLGLYAALLIVVGNKEVKHWCAR